MTAWLAVRDGTARPLRLLDQPVAYARNGSHSIVQTSSGNVAVVFALERYDRHERVAIYSLRVFNESSSALICRVGVISRNGEATLAYPVPLHVDAFSVRATEVPVWLKDFDSFGQAIAEVSGGDVRCVVEASAPPQEARPRFSHVRLAGICAAAGLAMLALAGAGTAIPRIAALAVPPLALAGTTVQAEYDAAGLGTLAYSVAAPDGRQIAGGVLSERAGSVPIALPASRATGAYTFRLSMRGPLGNVDELRVVNAAPNAPASGGAVAAPKARIDRIAVSPALAKPGETIAVSYAASARGGSVRLVGADGTIWAEKPYSPGGYTEFTVPQLFGDREMHAVLHVTRGNTSAEAAAGFVVAAASAPAAPVQTAPAVAGDDEGDSPGDGYANGTFNVVSRTVPSGGSIHVAILSPRNGMRIALADTQSHEVTGTNVGADQQTVTLRAPTVRIATKYTVVASFTDGFGQESVVQPVTVVP